MIIHVKPDKNSKPTYIIEGKKRQSIPRQILNGIIIALKIIFFATIWLCIIVMLIYLYNAGAINFINSIIEEII